MFRRPSVQIWGRFRRPPKRPWRPLDGLIGHRSSPWRPLDGLIGHQTGPWRPLEGFIGHRNDPSRPPEGLIGLTSAELPRRLPAPTRRRPDASPPPSPLPGGGWKRPLLGRGGGEQDTHAARRKRGGFLERSQNGTCGQTAFCLKRSCMHILASFVAQCTVLFGGPWALSRQSVAL